MLKASESRGKLIFVPGRVPTQTSLPAAAEVEVLCATEACTWLCNISQSRPFTHMLCHQIHVQLSSLSVIYFYVILLVVIVNDLVRNQYSLCFHFNGHFPGGPGLAGTRMSPFWILLKQSDGDGGDN